MIVNDEFNMMWEGAAVTYLLYHHGTCVEGPRKTTLKLHSGPRCDFGNFLLQSRPANSLAATLYKC